MFRFLPSALVLVAGLAPLLPAAPHLGPVSDIELVGETVYSVSQAGIFAGVGAQLRLVSRPSFRVISLVAAPDGTTLLLAGGDPGRSGSFGMLNPSGDGAAVVTEVATDLVYDLAIGPAGRVLACADGAVLQLPAQPVDARWSPRHRHTAAARAVAFSPDGKWLASAGLDGVVILSEADAPADASPRQLSDHSAGVESLRWSPDSSLLASGSRDSKVRLHDVSGKLVRTYNGLGMQDEPVAGRVPARVLALAWKDDLLLAGTSNGALYQLSLTDDTMRQVPRESRDPIHALAIAGDGTILLGTDSRLEEIRPVRGTPD